EVGDHVAQRGQKQVRLVVPEVKHAVDAAMKAVAKDHVGPPRKNGLEQRGKVGRIVFQVRVLHQDDLAGHMLKARADGGALALVALVHQHTQRGAVGRLEFLEDLTGAVLRAVIHNNEFAGQANPDRHHALDDVLDGFLLVVTGNNDGKSFKRWRRGRWIHE